MSALIDHRRDQELLAPARIAAANEFARNREAGDLIGSSESVRFHVNAGAAK
jgi:hypothetical protein